MPKRVISVACHCNDSLGAVAVAGLTKSQVKDYAQGDRVDEWFDAAWTTVRGLRERGARCPVCGASIRIRLTSSGFAEGMRRNQAAMLLAQTRRASQDGTIVWQTGVHDAWAWIHANLKACPRCFGEGLTVAPSDSVPRRCDRCKGIGYVDPEPVHCRSPASQASGS